MKKIPQGWQCPVCKKIHSPMVVECNCDIVFPEPNIYKARTIFITPTIDEVTVYCKERANNVDPEKWVDFYQAKNWMIGRNKMKDWKAAVRTWERQDNNYGRQQIPVQKKIATNLLTSRLNYDSK